MKLKNTILKRAMSSRSNTNFLAPTASSALAKLNSVAGKQPEPSFEEREALEKEKYDKVEYFEFLTS